MLDGEVDIPVHALADVLGALHKKRIDLIKIQNRLNEAPKGLADLLGQSRKFVETLSSFLEDGSELSETVKKQLLEDDGFPGQVSRLPFGELFNNVDRVKEELRIADGYQPYIVAPEDGLRFLFNRAVDMLVPPVNALVDEVHKTVSIAAEKALRHACEVPALEESAPPVVRFPVFVENIMPVVSNGLADLKTEARDIATNVVEMEKSYLSCSFFRYLTFKRLRDTIERRQSLGDEEEEEDGHRFRTKRRDDDGDEEEDFLSEGGSDVSTPRSTTPVGTFVNLDTAFGISGTLEKSSSHSRNKTLKSERSLWQKRYFGVKEGSKDLEYYSSEEAFRKGSKPKAVIDLSTCVVEDTEGEDLPTSTLGKSIEHLDRDNSVSRLIRIRKRNPRQNLMKDSKDMILRMPNASEKYRWLSYLKQIINDPRSGAVVASRSSRHAEVPQEEDKYQKNLEDMVGPVDAGYGLGSAVFWSPVCRDNFGMLLPSPGIFLEGDVELSMEKALRQHTKDMEFYTQMVCQTLTMTIPKVIVHCLVDRAQRKLGPIIEQHILQLGDKTRDSLLEEDPGLAIHRDNVNKAMLEVGDAEDVIKAAQKEKALGDAKGDSTRMHVRVIVLAGLTDQLAKHKNAEGMYVLKTKPPPAPAQKPKPQPANTSPTKPEQRPGPKPNQTSPGNEPRPALSRQSMGPPPSQIRPPPATGVRPARRAPPRPPGQMQGQVPGQVTNRAISPNPGQNVVPNGGPRPNPQQAAGQPGWFQWRPFNQPQ